MSESRSRRQKIRRRVVSIPGVAACAVSLTVAAPLWIPIALVVDLVRLRTRLPLLRLLLFATCWAWIEVVGVTAALALWLRRRTDDERSHYALMGWWAGLMMKALSVTVGISPRLEGREALAGGNAIVLARHASLGDSLLSAWAIATESDVWPRYVLKRELLHDPCLEIVGLRVPNHFVERSTSDDRELEALRELAAGVGPGIVGVIFSEGTRANPEKRRRALEKIAQRDPVRAERLRPLRRLLPPRPSGTLALVEGAPGADVVLAWHTGFDGLDTFGGMIEMVGRGLPPVRFVARRIPRTEVPSGESFVDWLDERWLEMDAEVDAALAAGAGSTS